MAQVEVTMPKMGESITEGTIIAWQKKPGDRVDLDETLLEIGTDKVDTEVPSPAAGTLKEVLAEEGDVVEVGSTIAILETEAEVEEDSDEPAGAPSKSEQETEEIEPEEGGEEVAEPTPDTREKEGGEVEVVMPKMGESITEGTIITWYKQPGETVELDETLLEIGTDKVDTEVPSPVAGVLKSQLAEEGDIVEVGAVIAVITSKSGAAVSEGDGKPNAAGESVETEDVEAQEPSGDGAAASEAEEVARTGSDGRFFSPLVRSIADKEGLSMQELESIEGSGMEGRVTKEDVLAFLETKRSGGVTAPESRSSKEPAGTAMAAAAAAKSQSGGYEGRVEVVEMDRMRQIIAEHMVRSKQTSAHVTSFAEADATNLVRLRERNKASFLEREGVRLTYTPFFVQAAVQALREHPVLNASVEEKRILVKKDLHIGIAVAIGKQGLVAPVIRHAGQQNIVGLSHAAAELAERARNRQLQPDELQGGTFTITNIGSLGSIMGTPIINQPQVGILAVGAIKKRPVVVEDPDFGDTIAIRQMMYISLSYDHRIIDGAMGASFLGRFVEAIESYDPDAEL